MPKIEFGTDGIRGIAGEWPLISFNLVQIGQALGQFMRSRSVHPVAVVGRDTRPTGSEFLSCLIAGLDSQGIDVVDLGVMTTPGVAFLTRRLEADLGIAISASHSPVQYNGIKVIGPKGLRLQREDEIEIERLIENGPISPIDCEDSPAQRISGKHLIELYVSDHTEHYPIMSLNSLHVVLDCANGAAARVAPDAFRQLGARVTVVSDALEGMRINHQCGSEHAREFPADLADIVREHEADYGYAFDGDGDRLTVVDAAGHMFDGNDLLFVLARHYRSQGQLHTNTIVTTHLANSGLIEALGRIGIQTVLTSKGDKNLEAAMWGGGHLLGSEPIGNVIINDGYHTAADAVYTALVLSRILVYNQPVSLAEMVAPLYKRLQKTVTLDLQASPALERAVQEEARRRQAELGNGGRVLCWGATTEPGRFRIMVEGSPGSTLAEVSQITDDICQAIRTMANNKPTTEGSPI